VLAKHTTASVQAAAVQLNRLLRIIDFSLTKSVV